MNRTVFFLTLISIVLHGNMVVGQRTGKSDIRKNSVQKNLRIARQLVDLNKEDSALLHLDAVLYKQVNNRDAIFLRASIYTNLKQFDKALTDYNALLELEPENREATYSRGVIRYLLEQYEYALEDLEKSMTLPCGETNTAYFKIDPATQMVTGVATLSKMEGDIWNYTGLCYMGLTEYDQALESFNRGIRIAPDFDDLYINRALTYEALGNSEMATKDYELVISRNPGNSTAAYNLMNLQGASESNNEKLVSLNSFIEDNPKNAHGYSLRGLYYFDSQSFNMALPDLRKAWELSSDNADYLFNLALCYERLEDMSRAEACFLQVVDMEQTNSAAYFNLGNIKFKEKLYDEAIALYTLANMYNPENTAVLYNRALAYLESDMQDEACADMQKVMKVRPTMANKFYSKYCKNEDQ